MLEVEDLIFKRNKEKGKKKSLMYIYELCSLNVVFSKIFHVQQKLNSYFIRIDSVEHFLSVKTKFTQSITL